MSAKIKFYVVWEGRRPGVYNTWDECKRNIEGFPNAKYKSFASRKEAEAAYEEKPARHIFRKSEERKATSAHRVSAGGSPKKDSICVDAACSGNPGLMEYRGVDFISGEEIFHMGPFKEGTNNIGEFLAIVHGLALLRQQHHPSKIIYSDSKIAIGWVKKKKCGTKLELTRHNGHLFDLIHRAERWLENNTYQNPILKWETEVWGEIPADFGRK
ncbi:MAG: ribonuclease H family protein [Bacteroidia bacterium]|nr:ribonuclease H family protein [Bacteroidia bacterium]